MGQHILNPNARPPIEVPNATEIAAMEGKACQFAQALLTEGYALAGKNKHFMARLLVIRAAAKAIARISKEEGILPSMEIGGTPRLFAHGLEDAIKDEVINSAKIAAMQMKAQAKAGV